MHCLGSLEKPNIDSSSYSHGGFGVLGSRSRCSIRIWGSGLMGLEGSGFRDMCSRPKVREPTGQEKDASKDCNGEL